MAKRYTIIALLGLLLLSLSSFSLYAQKDSLSNKQLRKERRKEFKKSVLISGSFLRADLETSITFKGAQDILSLTIGLENNLGLEKLKLFFTGSVLWRITPRSGVYASFYNIHRRKSYHLDLDLPFLNETFPNGTDIETYFNTDVTSLGYMFTLVDDEHAFLGAFINIYLMSLRTGIISDGESLNENLKYLAPLPDIGLMATFSITKWLTLKGKIAVFALKIEDYSGKINDFSMGAVFRITPCLGGHISYEVFNISVVDQHEYFRALIEYDYRGPAFGITLKF